MICPETEEQMKKTNRNPTCQGTETFWII